MLSRSKVLTLEESLYLKISRINIKEKDYILIIASLAIKQVLIKRAIKNKLEKVRKRRES